MKVPFRHGEEESSGPKALPYMFEVRSSKPMILSTVGFALFTDIFLYGSLVPVFPFALGELAGVPQDSIQHMVSMLLALFAAGLFFFSPVFGYIGDRTRTRSRPFLLGLIALIGATLLLCLGRAVWVFVLGRILQGIAGALVWTIGLAIVSDSSSAEKVGEAMGYAMMPVGLAVFLGPMLGGIVFARAGYNAVFAMNFACIAVDVILRLIMIDSRAAKKYLKESERRTEAPNEPLSSAADVEDDIPTEPTRKKRKVPTIIALLKSPRLLTSLWGCCVQAILLTSFDSVLPLYVSHTFGWDSLGGGLIFLPLCVPTFFEPLIGAMSDRYGIRWMATLGFLGCLPFFVLLRLVTEDTIGHKVMLCAFLLMIGFGVSCVLPPLMADLTKIVLEREAAEPGVFGNKGAMAQAYALFNMVFAAGTTLGPIWSGYVIEKAGWGTVGWSLGLLSGLTAVPTFIWSGGPLKLPGAMSNRPASAQDEEAQRAGSVHETKDPALN